MRERYEIERGRDGCAILLDGTVVAITTGDWASARSLVGQADFRAEVEAWLTQLREDEMSVKAGTTKFFVEVRGFDRVRGFHVWAEDEDEAREMAMDECHIGVTVKPAVDVAEQVRLAREEESP
jgi:hypothetical protein